MKSVCPMVCQKNENVLHTPCKPADCLVSHTPLQQNPRQPLLQTLSKNPLQTICKPFVPLEGLTFSALKQKPAGWIQSMACFASLAFIYKSKGFLVPLLSTPKRRKSDHSTNPCGKPSFSPIPFLPPWGGLYTNAPE